MKNFNNFFFFCEWSSEDWKSLCNVVQTLGQDSTQDATLSCENSKMHDVAMVSAVLDDDILMSNVELDYEWRYLDSRSQVGEKKRAM